MFDVRDDGSVWSLEGVPIPLYTDARGYLQFTHKGKTYSVHREVALKFIPNPNSLPTVNHKNGVKTNNRVENLEWLSHADNTSHANDLGLVKRQKLSCDDVRKIRRLYNAGDTKASLSRLTA